jgi:hypothetical protein
MPPAQAEKYHYLTKKWDDWLVVPFLLTRAAAQKLNISESQQDDDNHQDQAEAAGGIITPTTAVRPMGKRPDQEQQDND